ncbi:MAG: ATP-binding protein [Sulfurovaceae bacterium]|nr:ATP-binding protein [Sulfurovaceae bacterium]
MKNLPIGIQTFQKIRDKEKNYIYIDKTEMALNLIDNANYYFLSRPRRFGKSLFLDMLKELFEGKKELFTRLYAYDNWDWDRAYPVIKINFAIGITKSVDDFNLLTLSILKENQERLGVESIETDDARTYFYELIQLVAKKYDNKVVILVDEYDKPMLDNITNKKIAKDIRDELRNIYAVIKGSDQYIKFVFLTGVSKFSKVNLFSELNHLLDISLDERYATICGYTHEDIKSHFSHYLEGIDLEQFKQWYNGYNFLGTGVYNPFDVLLFCNSASRKFKSYWFETANPSFLIDVLKERDFFLPSLENIQVDESAMSSFDIEQIELEILLFQTGYLTIKEEKTVFNHRFYTLTYPNLEVRSALNSAIFKQYLSDKPIDSQLIFNAIGNKNMEQFEKAIYQLFASLPYNSYVKNDIQNYEGYYANVMYAYLAGLGIEFKAEDVTNLGRIDLTIATPDMSQVYVIEFKVVDNKNQNGKALEQIKEKKYHEKYQEKADELILIGIEFSKEDKNISKFEWDKIL